MRFAEISRVQCDIKVSLEFPGLGHPKESPEWLEEEETLLFIPLRVTPSDAKSCLLSMGALSNNAQKPH